MSSPQPAACAPETRATALPSARWRLVACAHCGGYDDGRRKLCRIAPSQRIAREDWLGATVEIKCRDCKEVNYIGSAP